MMQHTKLDLICPDVCVHTFCSRLCYIFCPERLKGESVEGTDTVEELVEAVKVFDRGLHGIIIAAGLRSVMTYTGEKLNDEEGDEVASWSSSSRCRYQSATSR